MKKIIFVSLLIFHPLYPHVQFLRKYTISTQTKNRIMNFIIGPIIITGSNVIILKFLLTKYPLFMGTHFNIMQIPLGDGYFFTSQTDYNRKVKEAAYNLLHNPDTWRDHLVLRSIILYLELNYGIYGIILPLQYTGQGHRLGD